MPLSVQLILPSGQISSNLSPFYDLQEITTPATIEFNSRYADNDSTDLIVSR